MKRIKIVFFLWLMCAINLAHAVGNPSLIMGETGQEKGVLSMKELYMHGIKSHDNVKIELDFETSTFKVMDAVVANHAIPDNISESITHNDVTVGLRGCLSENQVVTCHFAVRSDTQDRDINFCASSGCLGTTEALDPLFNSYIASRITLGSQSSTYNIRDFSLVAGEVVAATAEFSNISDMATQFSLMKIEIMGNTYKFRNVSLN